MNAIATVYTRLYGHALRKAFQGLAKSPWTVLTPVAVLIALALVSRLVAPLGFAGGLLYSLASCALFGAYLYFLGHVVSLQQAKVGAIKESLLAYFWSVLNVFFVMWIANLVIGLVVQANPQFGVLSLFQLLFIFVMLNATPEVIYLRGTYGGLETLGAAFRFLQENWIEWFAPHLLIAAVAYALFRFVLPVVVMVPFLFEILAGVLLHVVMVFRGNLFQALDGSSHRQRMFKYRNAAPADD